MSDLKETYQDDVLTKEMNGERKYLLTFQDGRTETVTIKDVSEYSQQGDEFGAAEINAITKAVNRKIEPTDLVDPMVTTEEGFAADAKLTGEALSELNSKLEFTKTIPLSYTLEDKKLTIHLPKFSNGLCIVSGYLQPYSQKQFCVFFMKTYWPLLLGFSQANMGNADAACVIEGNGNTSFDIVITGSDIAAGQDYSVTARCIVPGIANVTT